MKKFTIILSAATAAAVAVTILTTAILVSIKKPDKAPISSVAPGHTSTYTPPQYDVSDNSVWSDPSSDTSPDTDVAPVEKWPTEYTKNVKRVSKVTDLNEPYKTNSITTVTLKQAYKDQTLEIGQVHGLKDQKVQDALNKRILDTLCSYVDLLPEDGQFAYGRAGIETSYANLICVSYQAHKRNTQSDVDPIDRHFVYSLIDGLPVRLEDMFIDGTDVYPIVNKAFHDRWLSIVNYYNDGPQDSEGNPLVNEYDLYKFTRDYMSHPVQQFRFDDFGIYLYAGNERMDDYSFGVRIKFSDIYDKVAIFNRFETKESLFVDDSIGQKYEVRFGDFIYPDSYSKAWGYLEDNLWYEINLYSYGTESLRGYFDAYTNYCKTVYQQKKQDLEKYRQLAKQNPDKMYIILQKAEFDYSSEEIEKESGIVQREDNIAVYELSKKYYDDYFIGKLYHRYRERKYTLENPNDKNVKYTQTCTSRTIYFAEDRESEIKTHDPTK